jgi:hypothetical protein
MSEPAWIQLLRARTEQLGSRAAAAREIGYSRSAVSLALDGKYPARDVTRLSATVTALYTRCDCPSLATEITAGQCRGHRMRPMPQSNPDELRFWASCQGCAIGARLAEAEVTRRGV